MAKKKRKHFIKLNNKIKSIFDNKPFEDGVATLDDDTLYGLLMILGDDIGSLDRNDIIKYIRRVWSEGNYSIRKAIVDFLDDKSKSKKRAKLDKIESIVDMLDGEDATAEEIDTILNDFIDKKLSKITPQKVKKKLFYIRKKKILDRFAKLSGVEFVGANSIEFIEPYTLEFEQGNITINIVYSIELDIPTSDLIKKDDDFIIQYLNIFKQKARDIKNREIEKFLENIKEIDYLTPKILYKTFSSIKEPISDLYHMPIPLKIVKKILRSVCDDLEISYNKSEFLLSKSFRHNFLENEFEFDVFIKYQNKVLYGSIWTNNINEIISDIKSLRDRYIVHFELYIEDLLNRLKDSLYPIELSDDELKDEILNFIKPFIKANRSIELSDKISRKTIYHINEKYKDLKEKKKRELLLAKTIRDFKSLFPVARSLNREIIFNVGPTNSGKTYAAMSELKEAQSGLYLAPLRLLALEGYENLKKDGINVSLITGEEEIIDEDSTHISSTIEMLNSDIEVDVCVIDEIQMIGDRDRGWAWANALIGAPAKKVILTGSSDALNVVKEIANYLNEPLKIVEFERKNPLKLLDSPVSIKNIEASTAIVTFSRKEVLALKNKISPYFKTSVVYGNLSPEVRREEARRFREGESEVLIATDAIAMGLNLPIKTILFAKDNKFDGLQRRELTTSEVLQIAGRAGRYGLHEYGYVGALDHPTLNTIKEKFNGKLKPIELPISVMASLEHVLLIGEILQTTNLLTILEFFASNMEFEGPFVAANIDSMIEVAKIVDEYDLDLVSKYHLACAPVSINSPYLEKAFHRYLKLLEENKEVPFIVPNITSKKAVSYSALLTAEDIVKEVSLYLWLSFKFGDKFPDTDIAKKVRDELNGYIERTLQDGNFKKECNRCGKELDLTYRFNICDKCYNKIKRGYKKIKTTKKDKN